jgi:uncharacterized protein YbjT (DUF2867 family)
MRILVTGASSQTGSLAVHRLADEGHEVRWLSRTGRGAEFMPPSAEKCIGDLEVPESLREPLRGVDAVVQVAHIRFAQNLIEVCREAGVGRVVFFSSTRRYTKFDCESARQVREGEAAIEASGLDYTILRPSMIYGSRRDNNVSRLIAYLRRHRFFPLIGGGRNLVQPVFVLDVVEALVRALDRAAAVGAAYTLAGPEPLRYREMIATIARALGRPATFVPVPNAVALLAVRCYGAVVRRPCIVPDQIRRMAEDRAFDIAPARADLGFDPTAFDEGVRRQVAGEIDAVWENGRC